MDNNQPFFVGINNKKFRGVSMDGYLPALEQKPGELEPTVKSKFVYFKNDIRALELNHRVTELENSNRYLLKKIKELTAYAFKRRPKDKV